MTEQTVELRCGCEEHVNLVGLALVLHEQGIGCGWRQVKYRDEYHLESVPEDPTGFIARQVYTAGPFPHDGWHHDGDHYAVVQAIATAPRP